MTSLYSNWFINQPKHNALKTEASIDFITKHICVPWHCCSKQNTSGNSFISKRESLSGIGIQVWLDRLCWLCHVGLCWTAGLILRLLLWCLSHTQGLFINALLHTDLLRIMLHLDMVQTVLEYMYAYVFVKDLHHSTCFAALRRHQQNSKTLESLWSSYYIHTYIHEALNALAL